MSTASLNIFQDDLTTTVATALTSAMLKSYPYLPEYEVQYFSAGVATGLAEPIAQAFYPQVQQISQTAIILGLSLFLAILAFMCGLILWINKPNNFRTIMMLITCTANLIAVPILYCTLTGAGNMTNVLASYIYSPLIATTEAGVMMANLFQAVTLWQRRPKMIYRVFAAMFTLGLHGYVIYISIQTLNDCPPGLHCQVKQKYITVIAVVAYIVLYMIPFVSSLRHHAMTAKKQGLKTNKAIQKLELRTWYFALPGLLISILIAIVTYVGTSLYAPLQMTILITIFALVEILKDSYLSLERFVQIIMGKNVDSAQSSAKPMVQRVSAPTPVRSEASMPSTVAAESKFVESMDARRINYM